MHTGSVSLRFSHPYIDLTFIGDLLQLPCSRTWMAGTERSTLKGDPLPGKYKESYWYSSLEFSEHNRFVKELTSLVNLVSNAQDDLIQFNETGGRVEIYLALPGEINVGDDIDAKLVYLMGSLGITFIIEVFP